MSLTHERIFSTGTLIRRLREEQGISLSEFARRNNIEKQTLYKYERDIIRNINYDVIKMFADALDVNPAYLVGWSNIKERTPELGLISGSEPNTDSIIKQHINECGTIKKETYTTTNIGE